MFYCSIKLYEICNRKECSTFTIITGICVLYTRVKFHTIFHELHEQRNCILHCYGRFTGSKASRKIRILYLHL